MHGRHLFQALQRRRAWFSSSTVPGRLQENAVRSCCRMVDGRAGSHEQRDTMKDERAPSTARRTGARGTQVYHALVERIRNGEFKRGARIREESVAAMLDVSRTPVREAFARLQARGLLEASPGGLSIATLNRPQVMELYAMRAKLEAAAAGFAAENASGTEIMGITHMADLFDDESGGGATNVARANRLFHEAIYEAAHNRYLLRMLEDLNDSLALLPETTFTVHGRADQARNEHRAIVTAIAARDPATAEAAASEHILKALSARLSLLFSMDSRSSDG